MVNLSAKSAKVAAKRNAAATGHFYFIEVGAHFALLNFLRRVLSTRAQSFSSSITIEVQPSIFDSLLSTYEDLRWHYMSPRHATRAVSAVNC